MADATNQVIVTALEVTGPFSLELAFCEAGKDNGLLPINNFVMQLAGGA